MITKQIENTKVTYYTDAAEYAKNFFDVPEGFILDIDKFPESAGFSSIDDNEIWIFKGQNCSFEELLSTIAHELGHIVKGGYKKNPSQNILFRKIHELKATHYENFVVKSYRIASILFNECQ
jgi:Zn-dependent peptidase ImmA (M78 family)